MRALCRWRMRARVVALRARALMQLSGQGAMAAVELSAAATRERIAPYADRVAIAAINGPASTLVSGEPGAIERLLAELSEAQVFARAIRVDYASHCAQVEGIREELERSLQGIAPGRLSIPLYSTVTGGKVERRGAGRGILVSQPAPDRSLRGCR